MTELWQGVRDLFINALDLLHGMFDSFLDDDPSWGWAIITLTVLVRILLIPLAVKQFRSMRAMQELSPKIKAVQKRYKPDRALMKQDPEKYRAMQQKMSEEMQKLYKEAGVNPAGGCLPLLAQAPIFIALFSVLRSNVADHAIGTPLGDLLRADFYFLTPDDGGLSVAARDAGIWGWALIVLMAGSMFFSQKQMMARNAANADPMQLQQQRIMMIVMPVFLAFISIGFPMGVLLYWVTTNLWQVGQQAFIVHEVRISREGITRGSKEPSEADGAASAPAATPSSNGRKGGASKPSKASGPRSKASSSGSPKNSGGSNKGRRGRPTDQLPGRKPPKGKG